MTRDERLTWLKEIEKDIYVCSLESTFSDDAKSCAIHSAIEELEEQTAWIPVTERLPDEMGMYLVTLDYQEKGKGVVSLWFHNDEIGWNRGWNENVTAWMPLPKPYKAGESE